VDQWPALVNIVTQIHVLLWGRGFTGELSDYYLLKEDSHP
jgi:hypothetical protein